MDAALFFPKASAEDKMLAYAVCGGIPQYLNVLAQYENINEGIYEGFFKKSALLYEEPQNLLKQELREPAVYNSLISAIATGASKLNEIATKAGEDNKKCAKYLKTLLDLHIIRKEHPYGTRTERNGIYVLNDNMFRFMFFDIGRWWGTNPETKTQEEIDILADAEGRVIFAECKWQNADMRPEVLSQLQQRSMMFGRYDERYYYLFGKRGFHKELKNHAAAGRVALVDVAGLYGLQEDKRINN